MRRIVLAVMAAALMLGGCRKEDVATGGDPSCVTTLNAVYGQEPTRVAITPGTGTSGVDAVVWREGDKVMLYSVENDNFTDRQPIVFALTSGAGTKNATFTAEGAGLTPGADYVAVHTNGPAPVKGADGQLHVALDGGDSFFMTSAVTAPAAGQAAALSFANNDMSILEIPLQTAGGDVELSAFTVTVKDAAVFMRDAVVAADGGVVAAGGMNTVRAAGIVLGTEAKAIRIPVMWNGDYTEVQDFLLTAIDTDGKVWSVELARKPALLAGKTYVADPIMVGEFFAPANPIATSIEYNKISLNGDNNSGSKVLFPEGYKDYTIATGGQMSLKIGNRKEAQQSYYGYAAYIRPSSGDGKTDFTPVVYSSSDESVATVNSDGLVTGVTPGTAVITAALADGSGLYVDFNVSVSGEFVPFDRKDWDIELINATPSDASGDYNSIKDAGANPKGSKYVMFDGSANTAVVFTKPGKSIGNVSLPGDAEFGFIIDLGESKMFDAITFNHRIASNGVYAGGLRFRSLKLYCSNDGDNFIPISDKAYSYPYIPAYKDEWFTPLPQTTARYLKVMFDSWYTAVSMSVQVSEFNVGTVAR